MLELKQIMRQAGDASFAEILNRLREGYIRKDDLKVIRSRVVKKTDNIYQSRKGLPHLFSNNALVDQHNEEMYKMATTEQREIIAFDRVDTPMKKDLKMYILARVPHDPRKTHQLTSILRVAIGLMYEIVLNIDTSDGLTNGAGCVVKLIDTPVNGRASGLIWVKFEDETVGKKMLSRCKISRSDIDKSWVPLQAETRSFFIGKKHVEVVRRQFPLRPSNAKQFIGVRGAR